MKAYSLDLRQRVLLAVLRGDRTIPEVGELFGVSAAFLNKMLRPHRNITNLAPGRTAAATRAPRGRATTNCCGLASPPTTPPRETNCASTWLGRRASPSARRPSRGH